MSLLLLNVNGSKRIYSKNNCSAILCYCAGYIDLLRIFLVSGLLPSLPVIKNDGF